MSSYAVAFHCGSGRADFLEFNLFKASFSSTISSNRQGPVVLSVDSIIIPDFFLPVHVVVIPIYRHTEATEVIRPLLNLCKCLRALEVYAPPPPSSDTNEELESSVLTLTME